MNKKELLNLASSLDLPKKEYCIISWGACVLHDIRKETADLDIDVTKKGFEILKEKYSLKLIREDIKQYSVTDNIECFLVEKLDSDIQYIDNYPCESLISIYNFKKRLNRDKDQADILAIEKLLNVK